MKRACLGCDSRINPRTATVLSDCRVPVKSFSGGGFARPRGVTAVTLTPDPVKQKRARRKKCLFRLFFVDILSQSNYVVIMETMSDKQLFERLMSNNDWTQEELAQQLRIVQGMVSMVLNEKRVLRRSTRKLAEILLSQTVGKSPEERQDT